jgi:hypothetical protein
MELDLQTSHGIATGIGIDVKTEHIYAVAIENLQA